MRPGSPCYLILTWLVVLVAIRDEMSRCFVCVNCSLTLHCYSICSHGLQSPHGLQCLQQSWRRKLNIFPASNSCHDAQTRIYLFCSGFQPGSKLSKVNNSHEVLCPDQAMSDAGLHKQRRSPRQGADGLNMLLQPQLSLSQHHSFCKIHFSVLVRITWAMDWRSRSSWHSVPGAGARGHSGAGARAADCLAFSGARDKAGAMRWKRFVKFYKSICKC